MRDIGTITIWKVKELYILRMGDHFKHNLKMEEP